MNKKISIGINVINPKTAIQHLFIILALGVIVLMPEPYVNAMQKEKAPNGVWTNSFGSIMRLRAGNGTIKGYYSSTTGSSGVYKIVGFYDSNPGSGSKGIALSLAIPWRSYLRGKGDTSWHWASTMSGMYFAGEHEEKMELVNALCSSTVVKGQNPETGVYPESLTFVRYSDQHWQCPKAPPEKYSLNSPIIGTWKGKDITIVIRKVTQDGFIQGSCTIMNEEFPVLGCYDYNTKSPRPAAKGIQSVAIVVSNKSNKGKNQHSQLALSGILYTNENKMNLHGFKTSSLTRYTSNRLSYVTLAKQTDTYRETVPGTENGKGVIVLPVRIGLAKNNGASPWYVELGIGKSEADYQLFKFLFDTGTASTWITSKECDTVPGRHHRRYDRNQSSAHRWIDRKKKTSELGPWGEFAYKVSRDTWYFSAGGAQQNKSVRKLHHIPKMKFMEATELIDGKTPDGIFNTNWDDLVPDGSLAVPCEGKGNPSDRLLDMLVKHGYVDKKLVSYWTSRKLNRGEAIFGGFNESKYDNKSLKYYPVDNRITSADQTPELWCVNLKRILIGRSEVKFPSKNAGFVLDSGSSRFKGDPEIIRNIVNLITGNGKRPQKVTKSSDLNTYPDFTIVLVDQNGDSNKYTLTAHEYFQEFPDGWCLAFHEMPPSRNSSVDNLLLAGSIFLDNYYTVYDYTTTPLRVGIAERVDP